MATSKNPSAPKIDDDFLAGIKSADNVRGKQPATDMVKPVSHNTPAEKAKQDTPRNEKKVLCNIKVNESTLKNWKQFALDNDVTVTDAIKRAMNYYIKGIENGNIEL